MDTREIAKEYRLGHWAGVIRDRNASGLTTKAYCESAGICENVYYYWQRKLREAACEEFLPSASDNQIVPHGWAVCEEEVPKDSTTGITIEIGGFSIKVGLDVSANQLEETCRVLMKLC